MSEAPADHAELLRLGLAAHREGRLQEARRCYQRLLDLDPMHLETLRLAASATMQSGDPAAALALLDRAMRIDARHVGVLNERGVALWRLGRLEEALVSHAEAVRLKPDQVEALNNRGVMLLELGRPQEALASFEAAIRIRHDHPSSLSNLGNALFALGRLEEALASYSEAIRVKPGHAKALHNRGVALRDLRRFDEALADFEAVVRLKPGDADAIAKRGRLRMFLRRFPEAFADHRHRWADPDHASPRQPTTLPLCEPGTLRGRLLLWAEQGLGDELFFAGLLPELLKREVSVTLTADKRLHALLARAFPQVRLLERAVAMRASIDGGYDAQAPIGDLGYLLGMDDASIAASRTVYLKADERRCAEMRAQVAAFGGGRRVCGIAWRSANKKFSEAKSIDLGKLRPLLETPDTVFVNLQYGAVDAELEALHAKTGLRIHRIEGLDIREDIDGLTALIDACDTVVTASNVTAHLAGAIGKRTAVLVPHGLGRAWYWHEGDRSSLWYPSLRLFCQGSPSDWAMPVEACARWLLDCAPHIDAARARALTDRGVALQGLRRFGEALASFEAVVRLRPGDPSAFFNQGVMLQELARFDEAVASYSEAIRLKPSHAKAFHNRAVTLRELKRFDEALGDLETVIRLKPGDADAIAHRGRMKMFLRRFPEAFADYRHRWDGRDHESPRQPTTLPSSAPDALGGRLLLWAEQGIGDEVFFAGLLPELLKREVSVTLTADKRLHGLFARALPQVRLLDRAVTIRSSIDDGHDAQAPIGDLGYLLGMDEAAIAASRAVYLKADERRCAEMRAKLAALGGGRRVCGIAWRSANKKFSEAKSIDLGKLRPLLETPDTVFVNLQYGAVDAELEALHAKTGLRIHRIEGLDIREDIDGLTALIDACDTVVTASNVTAHLAGSIGKRTAVLVPHSKARIWYWHEGDEQSLWYPSVRLFCQDGPQDWAGAVAACAAWMRSLS
jgi:tetratricopeptide (TPR) repeat protein